MKIESSPRQADNPVYDAKRKKDPGKESFADSLKQSQSAAGGKDEYVPTSQDEVGEYDKYPPFSPIYRGPKIYQKIWEMNLENDKYLIESPREREKDGSLCKSVTWYIGDIGIYNKETGKRILIYDRDLEIQWDEKTGQKFLTSSGQLGNAWLVDDDLEDILSKVTDILGKELETVEMHTHQVHEYVEGIYCLEDKTVGSFLAELTEEGQKKMDELTQIYTTRSPEMFPMEWMGRCYARYEATGLVERNEEGFRIYASDKKKSVWVDWEDGVVEEDKDKEGTDKALPGADGQNLLDMVFKLYSERMARKDWAGDELDKALFRQG